MFEDIGRHATAIVLYTNTAYPQPLPKGRGLNMMVLPSYWEGLGVGCDLYFCSSTLVGILDKIDEHLFQLSAVSRQQSLTMRLYLWIESCDMIKEFTDWEGCPFRCLDAGQLAVTLYEVE